MVTSRYMVWRQIITGVLGIFGVGVFAVPVGLLGAGFEEWVETIQSKVWTLRFHHSCRDWSSFRQHRACVAVMMVTFVVRVSDIQTGAHDASRRKLVQTIGHRRTDALVSET